MLNKFLAIVAIVLLVSAVACGLWLFAGILAEVFRAFTLAS